MQNILSKILKRPMNVQQMNKFEFSLMKLVDLHQGAKSSDKVLVEKDNEITILRNNNHILLLVIKYLESVKKE
jgi:hypothetical protein